MPFDKVEGGYYSDTELRCQAFQICVNDDQGGLVKFSFLCPNGSLFDQQYFVCDYWFNVDCAQAEALYYLNDEIAAERERNIGAASTVNNVLDTASTSVVIQKNNDGSDTIFEGGDIQTLYGAPRLNRDAHVKDEEVLEIFVDNPDSIKEKVGGVPTVETEILN